MVHLWLPWLQEPFFFFLLTMVNFRKGRWKVRESIKADAMVAVKLLEIKIHY